MKIPRDASPRPVSTVWGFGAGRFRPARVVVIVCIVADRRARLANLSSRAGCGVFTRTLAPGDTTTTLGSLPLTTWNDYVRLHPVDPSYTYVHYDFGPGHGNGPSGGWFGQPGPWLADASTPPGHCGGHGDGHGA